MVKQAFWEGFEKRAGIVSKIKDFISKFKNVHPEDRIKRIGPTPEMVGDVRNVGDRIKALGVLPENAKKKIDRIKVKI